MKGSKFTKSLIFSFIMLLGLSELAQAQDYKSSIGGRLGTYVAATFSSNLSEGRSYELIAGITREANQSDFILGGFYKLSVSLSSDIPTLRWYGGPGLYINLESAAEQSNVSFAPALLMGMEYTLEHTPVNFFLDVSPYYITGSINNSKFNMHANLGVRYVLKGYD